MYATVVVGAGCMGSAAAKWVSELTEKGVEKIALVGAKEPEMKKECRLFGAWFDSGRIAELIDNTTNWRTLSEKSISRYREIEERSGIEFYEEVGFLTLIDDKYGDKEELEDTIKVVRNSGYQCDYVDATNVKTKFPELNITEDLFGYHQPNNSGHINPREMIRAQQKLAVINKCDIIHEEVMELKKENKIFILTLSNGQCIKASKVILALGAYLNFSGLLKNFTQNETEVDLTLTTQTVAYLRISKEEASRLQKMPTIVTTYKRGALDGTYILPPIKYPDDKIYLKLGHHDYFERTIESTNELAEWYKSEEGDSLAVAELANFLQAFIKGLKVENVSGGCCVTSNTPSKAAPYVQEVDDGLVVAGGGCGYAAMSSDEIGRIAAVLVVEGKWDSKVNKGDMELVWRKKSIL